MKSVSKLLYMYSTIKKKKGSRIGGMFAHLDPCHALFYAKIGRTAPSNDCSELI
jgi:hypothetical protein